MEKNENRARELTDDQGRQVVRDVTDCEECGEVLSFAMRDNYHDFFIGLYTILKCLRIAEAEGYVPPLPETWWNKIWGMY